MLLTLHFCPSVATYRYPQSHKIRNRRCFSSLIQKPSYQIHNTGQREIMIATRDRQFIHYSTTSWQTASMLLPAGSCKKSRVNKTFRSNCGQNFITFEMVIQSHSDFRISGWTGANITYNNEGPVIMSVIVRPKARLAVVFGPCFNGCVVPSVDGCPVCLFMPHRQKMVPLPKKKSPMSSSY